MSERGKVKSANNRSSRASSRRKKSRGCKRRGRTSRVPCEPTQKEIEEMNQIGSTPEVMISAGVTISVTSDEEKKRETATALPSSTPTSDGFRCDDEERKEETVTPLPSSTPITNNTECEEMANKLARDPPTSPPEVK